MCLSSSLDQWASRHSLVMAMAEAYKNKISHIRIIYISICVTYDTIQLTNSNCKVKPNIQVVVSGRNPSQAPQKCHPIMTSGSKPMISSSTSRMGLAPFDLKTKEVKNQTINKQTVYVPSLLNTHSGTGIGLLLFEKERMHSSHGS